MALKYMVLCAVILAASLRSVKAISDEEKKKIQEALLPAVMECGQEFGADKDKIKEAKEKGDIDSLDSCLFACVFRKVHFMDDKGLFDKEGAMAKARTFLSKEEDIKELEDIADDCIKVNEEAVSDGEKGCDRAKLMLACLLQHKEKFAA